MTSTDLILGAISNAAQSNAMLRGILVAHDSSLTTEAAYLEVTRVTTALAATGQILRNDYAGCWMIGKGATFEDDTDPAPPKRGLSAQDRMKPSDLQRWKK